MTMRHLPMLKSLLPTPAYDPNGAALLIELQAAATALDAADNSANRLLGAANPARLTDLLPEWETAYGLPDSCNGESPATTEGRLGALIAKMAASLPMTLPRLEAIADALGYPATLVRKRNPVHCASPCFGPLNGQRQRFVLDVLTPYVRFVRYTPCTAPCDSPIGELEEPLLECVFRKVQPAHALFMFHYGVT